MIELSRVRTDAHGFSLLEVLVSVLLFSFVILGLTAAGIIAGAQLRRSGADIGAATAVYYQLEKLTAEGYDSVSAGSATVQGYPMSWDVLGTDPKRVVLVVQFDNGKGVVRPDTFVTYLADRTP